MSPISGMQTNQENRKVISPVGWSQRIQPPPPGTSTGHKKSWDQWSQSSLDQTGLGPGPPVIRDPMDLHNLSQDSGLSQSPILYSESPQLTIGSPIRHIEAARNGREKGGRWSISALFRKKSATTKGLGSEMTEIIYNHDGCSSTGGGSAGIVENNGIIRRGSDAHQYGGYSNVIKANIETPPPLPPRASSRGRVSGHQPPPAIFPHLKPDFGYPDAQPAGQGFYFHPSYGYVRRGSYSDNQVQNFPTARECVSSRSSGVDSDLTGSLDLAFKELDRRTDHPANMPVPEKNSQQGQYVKNRRSVSESRHRYCT